MKKPITGTFSILAISPDSKLMGVAVASGSTSVGDRVPHAKPGVGVIATQAYTNVAYGIKGLELMTKGLSPEEALDKLLREDPERELRQVAIMDFKRRKAVFTGVKAPEHRLPENHQCPNLPKEPFWYQKQKAMERETKQKQPIKEGEFYFVKEESPSTQLKAPKPKIKERRRNTLVGLLLGCAIFLLGLGITIWEIYNRLFWTIILVWFIPIPLVLIGGFFVILGIIVAASSVTTFICSLSVIKKIVAIFLIVMILGVVLWNLPSIFLSFQKIIGLQPSPTYSHEELVNHALSLINSDRSNNSLSNVSLSSIDSGQQHADNMLKHHFFSHWDTNGYKPYMRYTLAGGRGAVAENIAWYYSSSSFDVKEAISDLELQMMYNDSYCDWGHRDNILNPFHNKVSIGIAFDNNNVFFVQDFENDYIEWSTTSVSMNGEVIMSGTFQHGELSAKWINIFHDNLPSNLSSEQLAKPAYAGSYTMRTFVGMIVSSGYESPEGITVTAQTWVQTGGTFQIKFNLSPAFNSYGEGVYTLCLQPDPDITEDSLTSYSFWYTR